MVLGSICCLIYYRYGKFIKISHNAKKSSMVLENKFIRPEVSLKGVKGYVIRMFWRLWWLCAWRFCVRAACKQKAY